MQCLSGWTSTHSTCPFCKAELNVVQPLPTWSEKAFRLFAAVMLLPLRHIARASAAADRRRDAAQRLTTSSDGTSAATSPSNLCVDSFEADCVFSRALRLSVCACAVVCHTRNTATSLLL
eukprot:7973-Heterococcus_DN1.PRE.1